MRFSRLDFSLDDYSETYHQRSATFLAYSACSFRSAVTFAAVIASYSSSNIH